MRDAIQAYVKRVRELADHRGVGFQPAAARETNRR